MFEILLKITVQSSYIETLRALKRNLFKLKEILKSQNSSDLPRSHVSVFFPQHHEWNLEISKTK